MRSRIIQLSVTAGLGLLSGCLSSTETASVLDDAALATKICQGEVAFGKTGTSFCADRIDFRFRDKGNPNGPRRKFVDFTKDAPLPTTTLRVNWVDCGVTGSVTARIADCSAKNANARWDGAVNSTTGMGIYDLVSRQGSLVEVWRDDRTKLLWSSSIRPTDMVAGSSLWCQAMGMGDGANDPEGICSNVLHQPNPQNPRSICSEGAGRTPALKTEDWSAGVYHVRKGGMGLNSAGARVDWHPVTMDEFLWARANGYMSANLLVFSFFFVTPLAAPWTDPDAAPDSSFYSNSINANPTSLGFSTGTYYRDDTLAEVGSVICVGKELP